MQVKELYDIEVESQPHDCNVEALKLLEEMGLTNQIALYKKNETGLVESRFPFNIASSEQVFAYRYNFSETKKLEEYKEPIPVRVLEIIKKAKDTGEFNCFQIWSKPGASYRFDPVAVALKNRDTYYFDVYLLATWGDAVEEYSFLLKTAKEKWRLDMENKIADAVSSITKFAKQIKNGTPKPSISRYNDNYTVSISDSCYVQVPTLE